MDGLIRIAREKAENFLTTHIRYLIFTGRLCVFRSGHG